MAATKKAVTDQIFLKEFWKSIHDAEKAEQPEPTESKPETQDESENRHGIGLTKYHKGNRASTVAKYIDYFKQDTPDRYRRPSGACSLLAAHHEMLKDDPERISTEFLENLIGVKCKCKRNKTEQGGGVYEVSE